MDNLKMHTPDLTAENFRKLAALFPNAVTETIDENGDVVRAIDADVLRQEIATHVVEGRAERYQFTWPGKRQAILTANAPISKTLRPCVEESVGRDGKPGGFNSENLYIEGDNLDVLKLLQETYLGKIKMIYIDPPYNTGNDFVYADDFAESIDEYIGFSGQYDEYGDRLVTNLENNGRFHTDWLNMMYSRLKLSRNLLAEDGVIFISIDEHESENMQKICDEIFGEKNLAATFIWTKTATPPSLSHKCRKTVEYIFAYEKSINPIKYFGGFIEGGDVPFLNTGNPRKKIVFPPHSIQIKYISDGLIHLGAKGKVYLYTDIIVEKGWNKNEVIIEGEFKWEQKTVYAEIEKGTYFIIKTEKFSIRFQRANTDDTFKTPTNFLDIELNKTAGVGTNETADKELVSLGMKDVFDYSKPISLILQIVNMICKMDSDAIILDFFSGSATTAHAVMQLNAEDGGHRQFIMVQIPEETPETSEARKAGYQTICEIGKERIRRAGAKIKEETDADIDYGFRVLKLDSSNMKDIYYTPEDTDQTQLDGMVDKIKADRRAGDLLFQVMLELGVPLSAKINVVKIAEKSIFNVGDNFLIAYFRKDITEEIVTEIAKMKPKFFAMKDSAITSDIVAANFEQIFKTFSPDTERRVL